MTIAAPPPPNSTLPFRSGIRRRLSARESEVLGLIAEGLTKPRIGGLLGISPRTVSSHLVRVFDALGAHNAAHAVALAYALGEFPVQVQVPDRILLSPREHQVVAGLADGLTCRQLAGRLGLADGTVKSHVRRAYGKLGAQSRAHAIGTAIRSGALVV